MAATASRGSSPFSRFGDSQSFNFDALKNFSALTPSIQSHLQKVYLTLSLTLVVASLGAYAHVLWGLGGALSSIASIAGVLWLNATPAVPANEVRLLSASSSPRLPVSSFASILPAKLCTSSQRFVASVGVLAFVATAAIFLCFSGAALLAKRREYLYLGGFLASAVSTMLALRLASIFFGGSNAVFQIEYLYPGGFPSSAVSTMPSLRFASIFFGGFDVSFRSRPAGLLRIHHIRYTGAAGEGEAGPVRPRGGRPRAAAGLCRCLCPHPLHPRGEAGSLRPRGGCPRAAVGLCGRLCPHPLHPGESVTTCGNRVTWSVPGCGTPHSIPPCHYHHVADALELLLDFVADFVLILFILVCV
ncbi:unnamed protein product [Closterium sp. NIES-54]